MIHLLIILCIISCISDLANLVFQRISAMLQKLEGNRAPTPPPMFNVEGEVPNAMGMVTNFALSKINIFMALRFVVGVISFISNLLLPYYLLSMFTKATNASYHRQSYSYSPFMILDLHLGPKLLDELAGVCFSCCVSWMCRRNPLPPMLKIFQTPARLPPSTATSHSWLLRSP